MRPVKAVHISEFESFFGFGLKCSSYDSNKTAFYYNSKMSVTLNGRNSIYTFLDNFKEIEWDREFFKFIIWISINYIGIVSNYNEKNVLKK